MANNPSDKPLEPLDKLLASTQQNLVGTGFAEATGHMVASYPTPGSMAAAAKLSGQVQCGQCHALNAMTANFCRNCGSPLPKQGECPDCKSPVSPGDNFCRQCGKTLII